MNPRHLLLFGCQMAVAVDEQAIQVAMASRFGKRSKIIDVRKIYFPSAAIATSELRQAFITRTVDEIVQELGRPSMITIAIGGPETAFRQLTLPALGRKALAASVNFQARKTLPFPITDCWFDHRVTWKYAAAESKKFRISLVGATRQLIDDRLQPFRTLGLPVQACVLAQDVIGQLMRQLPDFSAQANYALINIERTRSEDIVLQGIKPRVFPHIVGRFILPGQPNRSNHVRVLC